MKSWQQLGETEVVHDGWRKVFRKTFRMNRGEEFVAEILDAQGSSAAAVIALTPDNRVVIAKQFRVGPGKVMKDLPGGMVEIGEDPKDAVLRELREETGYVSNTIEKIGMVYKHSYMQSTYHYYLAYDCVQVDQQPNLDEGEEIEVELLSISELFESARDAMMTDTEALFFAYEKLTKLKDE